MKLSPPETQNLYEMVPIRLVEAIMDNERMVVLLVPRYHSKLARRFFGWLSRDPNAKVSLDELGSSVWGLIDGVKDVAAIADQIKEGTTEPVEQPRQRVATFIEMLWSHGYITFKDIAGERS